MLHRGYFQTFCTFTLGTLSTFFNANTFILLLKYVLKSGLLLQLQSRQNLLAADLRILFYGNAADFFEESANRGFLTRSTPFSLKSIGRILKSAARRFWCDCGLRCVSALGSTSSYSYGLFYYILWWKKSILTSDT